MRDYAAISVIPLPGVMRTWQGQLFEKSISPPTGEQLVKSRDWNKFLQLSRKIQCLKFQVIKCPTIWTHVLLVCVCVYVRVCVFKRNQYTCHSCFCSKIFTQLYGMHPCDGNSLHWFNTRNIQIVSYSLFTGKATQQLDHHKTVIKVDDHSYRAKNVV